MRKWSIQVRLVGPNGEDLPADIFDKVTYKLHPTFEEPIRSKCAGCCLPRFLDPCLLTALRAAFTKPPFRIDEEGWGEFELQVVFTPLGGRNEIVINHDLNFQQGSKYDTPQVLVSG
jgi:transcription initiation factor IIF auxiliary subunit